MKVYRELRRKYGEPRGQWSLWCKRSPPRRGEARPTKLGGKTLKDREEVVIGAILTQRTNWQNVALALNNLKKAKVNSLKDIGRLGERKLAPFIRPSGFYQTKAGYLFNLAEFIVKDCGGLTQMQKEDLAALREKLLDLKGIGPETCDSILLYALDKPIFVIDEYTRRLVKKRGLAPQTDYDFLQKLFEENIKKDFAFYQDFHALIVIDGKTYLK